MVTQELVEAVMRERSQEAARLQREHKARVLQGQSATPRGGLSRQGIKRLPLLSLVTRAFPLASVS